MAVKVFAFPPVAAVGSMWTVATPLQRSQSLITGRRYVSAFGRSRVRAAVDVSALGRTRSGAGYSEILKRHLDGGVHLVRLNSYPINWHLDHQRLAGVRSSQPIAWTTQSNPLSWTTGGEPLAWFSGTMLTGVVAGAEITVSGLPHNTLVARPGDFLSVFVDVNDTTGPVSQVAAEARSDGAGVAVIKLFDDVIDAGSYPRVNIGESDSRVFEVEDMPEAMQTLGQNWVYPWRFREVFADEVAGGFDEVDPW